MISNINAIFNDVAARHMRNKNNTDISIAAQYERVARLFAIVVAALGLAVLAGWAFHIAALKSVAPEWVAMKVNTAIGFLLAGTSLFFAGCGVDTPDWARQRVALAAAVALLGLLTLGEYMFGADFGIDQLLFSADPEPVSHAAPGRMAMATAAGFALTGLALAMLDSIRWRLVALATALAGILVGMLAILGYVYDVAALYGVGAYSSVALHTAAGFMTVNLGVLLARPRIGLMAIVTGNTVGGVVVRRLLPLAIIAPFLIGWLCMESERRGWIGSGFGIALVTLTYIILFTVFILRTGFVLLASNQKLLASELHHRTLVEWSPEAILMHRDGNLLYANPAANRMFGAPPGPGLTGQSIAALAHPDFRNIMLERAQCHVEAGASMPQIEVKFIKLDGTAIDVEVHDTVIVYDGLPAIHSSMRDITQRKRAQETQRWSTMLFANIQDGAVVTDWVGTILAVNPAFTAINGYAEADILGQNMRILQSGRQDAAFYQQMWQTVLADGGWRGELWNRRQNGEIYLERLTIHAVYNQAGRVANYVGTCADLTRLKHADKMEHLAHHDALTGLPNRLQLLFRLSHALETSQRQHSLGAVLFLDLDRFKAVNDTLGHPAGDDLLQQVATRLTGRMRGMDTLARLGGDEFVAVLDSVEGPDGAATVAGEFVRLLNQPFILAGGQEARIGGSVGIAMFPEHGDSAEMLLRHADATLYVAKAAGGNTYRFHAG